MQLVTLVYHTIRFHEGTLPTHALTEIGRGCSCGHFVFELSFWRRMLRSSPNGAGTGGVVGIAFLG